MSNNNDSLGYVVTKPMSELLPVEVLVLLNRWAKAKSKFYREDLYYLLKVKGSLIYELLQKGEMVPIKIITRDTPVIKAMRKTIANQGRDLKILNCYTAFNIDFHDLLDSKESHYYFMLLDSGHFGFKLAYPEDVYESMLADFQSQKEEAEKARAAFEQSPERQLLIQYANDYKNWQKARDEAARSWAKNNNIKGNFTKNWLKRLHKRGFNFAVSAPTKPSTVRPRLPQKPSRTYTIAWDDYTPGSITEIEDAINWVRQLSDDAGLDFPSEYCDICDWIEDNIDSLHEAICDQYRAENKTAVLEIMRRVLNGDIQNPEQVWQELTAYAFTFEYSIDMPPFIDYRNYGKEYYKEFTNWHKINLSLTGYWLVEFQCVDIPDIVFHLPFDRVSEAVIPIALDSLPKVKDSSSMGREISKEESRKYPLLELLALLGFSASDFPYELEPFISESYDFFQDDFSTFDDERNDFEEDEFNPNLGGGRRKY